MAGLQKILLVEDNPQLQEIYSITLRSYGYDVTVIPTGNEALQRIAALQPDFIFLDIMMPGLNGLEVLATLRNDPQYGAQHTKIVLLTNLGHDERIEEAWEQYADGYAVKAELNPDELVDIIKSFEEASVEN